MNSFNDFVANILPGWKTKFVGFVLMIIPVLAYFGVEVNQEGVIALTEQGFQHFLVLLEALGLLVVWFRTLADRMRKRWTDD